MVRTRLARLALAAALSLVLPAGALPATAAPIAPPTATIDEPTAEGTATVPYELETADGVTLRGWVFLPKGQRPVATVLEYTPYIDNNGSDDSESPGALEYLRDAGFAVARVSMRGTGRSGGCLHFGDRVDVRDVTAVIKDLATKRWSTGNIGMVGHSFPAFTQDMAVTTAPEPLKAVVPTSGVIDLWSLLTRRGAPLAAGLGVLTFPAWFAQTSLVNEGAPEHLQCPDTPINSANNAETATTGDRTAWFEERDLRDRMTGTRVPMLRTQGLATLGEGHILQIEGLWDRLRSDRTRFMLGQWSHEPPTAHREDWRDMVINWFDHYLRNGPKRVQTGIVEYQDDAGTWHTSQRWPPRSSETAIQLSGRRVVAGGEPAEPADQTFVSADLDPGPYFEDPNRGATLAACGPHQALYESPPVTENVLLAGNFEVDVTLSSTMSGGNFAVFIWKTSGNGSCPDPEAADVGRALMDLRHWHVPGRSRNFPVGTPTSLTLRSQPFASPLRAGERLVIAIGGGSVELTPDPLKPVLTVHKGLFRLPVTSGELHFRDQP